MKVIKGNLTQINHIDNLQESVVVIGNFDGLHKYHQKLIHEAERIAREDNLTLILVTFDQSFEDFFRGTKNKILTNQEKIDLVQENFAVDYYLELTVGCDLMSYDKLMFINWLKEVLHVQKIVEGSDFTFGTDKLGTIEDLQKAFGTENVVVFKRRNHKISSTNLRKFIQEGKVKKANRYLLKPIKKA